MTNRNDAIATSGVRYPSSVVRDGLTKREYFAAMALSGMCYGRKLSETPEAALTKKAVKMADALIEALNK